MTGKPEKILSSTLNSNLLKGRPHQSPALSVWADSPTQSAFAASSHITGGMGPMKVYETRLEGMYLIEPWIFSDPRKTVMWYSK
jgi:hypothetical protein